MPLNITPVMTNEQVVEVVKTSLLYPSLYIFYALSAFFILLTGLIMIDGSKGSHPYQKFFFIWLVSIVLMGVALAFVINYPNTIIKIGEFFKF